MLLDTVDLAVGTALYISTLEASYLDGRLVFSDWNMEKIKAQKERLLRGNLLISLPNHDGVFSIEIVGLRDHLKQ